MAEDKPHAEEPARLEILIQIRGGHNDVIVKATAASIIDQYTAVALLEQVKLKVLAHIDEEGKKTGDVTEKNLRKPLEG